MTLQKTALKSTLLAALLIPCLCTAANTPYYGGTLSYVAYGSEPNNLKGIQFMLNYDPERFLWRQFNIYFDGGYSHFWVPDADHNASINVLSAAPVIRYTFKKHGFVHPYLELSIGPAYLSQTRLDDRNLGIHFAFQDRMGVGTFLGPTEQVTLGVHAVHYSNAHLSSHNSGFSAPLTLDVGYRFG